MSRLGQKAHEDLSENRCCALDLRCHSNAGTSNAVVGNRTNNLFQDKTGYRDEGRFNHLSSRGFFQNECTNARECGHGDDARADNYVDRTPGTDTCAKCINFPSFARLNENTNGMALRESVYHVVDANNTDGNTECVWQVQQGNQKEIPLETVGLSLSLSGMELYVKVDSEEKKKIFQNNTMQTYEKSWPHTYICNGYNHQEIDLTACPNVAPSKEMYRQKDSRKVMPLLDHSGRYDTEEMDISNNEDHQRYCNHQDETDGQQQTRSLYIYNDLPVKHMAYQTCDSLKRHNEHLTESNHQVKRTKHNVLQEPSLSRSNFCLMHDQNDPSDNDDDSYYMPEYNTCENDDINMRMKAPVLTHHRNNNTQGHISINNESNYYNDDVKAEKEPSYNANSVSQTRNKNVYFMSLHDPAEPNSGHNTITVDNFAEYANNIRRNMKKDYRNLSNLIRDFSEEIQERNNNQSFQAETNEFSKDSKAKTNKEHCLLM